MSSTAAPFTGGTFRRRLARVLVVPMLLVTAIAAVLAVVVLRLSALSRAATASERVIGEDLAAETRTIGASDFVLKDRLDRLAPLIERWTRQPDTSRQRR